MKEAPSLESDSKVTQLDTTTFTANLTKSFCVGTVPHGGYVATIFLRVASAYLAPRNQPDPFAAHWQFLNATHAGPAVLIVEETKTGRAMSVVHITLYQEGLVSESPWISSKSKKKAVAYITNTLLEGERGVTLPTGFEMAAPPPPVDLEKLGINQDANWEPLKMTIMEVVPMLDNFEFYTPKCSSSPMATYDLWLRMSNGEGFTTSALGYVADAAPALLIEAFRPTDLDKPIPKGGFAFDKIFWYPTVTMSLEVKKPLAGEEWLRIRAASKVVNNGRYDAEIIVFDREGDIVALSNHVALAVDGERNFGRSEKL